MLPHMAATKHILLIDDSVTVLAAMTDILQSHGHTVSSASDLRQVDLQTHRSGDIFDLILVDVNMPEMGGDEIVLMLRTMRKFKAPIYFLSAMEPDELRRRAADVGAGGFISKNAGIESVARQVEQVLAGTA
jgi:CheY-like chemotaxis protein